MRYHRTFGLDARQLDELEARIEDILPDPWDKGTGRPKSLSLREAIMVTLLYKRQNIIEEVIADLFGVSQGTVSEIITEFTVLIAQATEEFRPDADEAKQMTRGRLALVDGTLWAVSTDGSNSGRGNLGFLKKKLREHFAWLSESEYSTGPVIKRVGYCP